MTKIYSATKKLSRLFMFHLSNLYFPKTPWARFAEMKLGWRIFHTYLICNSKEVPSCSWPPFLFFSLSPLSPSPHLPVPPPLSVSSAGLLQCQQYWHHCALNCFCGIPQGQMAKVNGFNFPSRDCGILAHSYNKTPLPFCPLLPHC